MALIYSNNTGARTAGVPEHGLNHFKACAQPLQASCHGSANVMNPPVRQWLAHDFIRGAVETLLGAPADARRL